LAIPRQRSAATTTTGRVGPRHGVQVRDASELR
jgi:hypothetical protein